MADSIEETLLSELSVKCLIGIGSVSSQMKDIAKSFKEATTAIEVGAVFDTEKNIISFENLGIGRLIYQLPITLCEMFLSEVFRKGSIDSLDQGDAVHDSEVLREQPERIRDLAQAVRTPQYAGVPP